jgi:hypothetical protein
MASLTVSALLSYFHLLKVSCAPVFVLRVMLISFRRRRCIVVTYT